MEHDNGQFDYSDDSNMDLFETQIDLFEESTTAASVPVMPASSLNSGYDPMMEYGKTSGASRVVKNVKNKNVEKPSGSLAQYAVALVACIAAVAMIIFVFLKLVFADVNAPVLAVVCLFGLLTAVRGALSFIENSARSANMAIFAAGCSLWCVKYIDMNYEVTLISYKFAVIPLVIALISLSLGIDDVKSSRSKG